MKSARLLIGAGFALSSAWALAQSAPESLLPPGFDSPAPTRTATPEPAPAPAPAASRAPSPSPSRSGTASSGGTPRAVSSPVVQAVPGSGSSSQASPRAGSAAEGAAPSASGGLISRIPSLEELQNLTPEEFEEVLGLKPKFDIPPEARRSTSEVGIIGEREGGFGSGAVAGQEGSLVRAMLVGNKGRLVSRWGHILLRRALASRLDAPYGLDPADFAAQRAALLLRMGEADAARALVQDVDSGNYTLALVNAALDAYIATGDFTGICPTMVVKGAVRDDPTWEAARSICQSFRGDGTAALRRLDRDLSRQTMPRIDLLLAQRYAGAAGKSRRAVTIEWDQVKDMTPWRYGLAQAIGLEPPKDLVDLTDPYYAAVTATGPAVGLVRRATAADRAAANGVLSSKAMVDLYSQIYTESDIEPAFATRAETLRDAYVAASAAGRLAAIEKLWSETTGEPERYSRMVLTGFAAARLPVSADMQDKAADLIASMLAAGLDRNALRWADQAPVGSEAWALLVLAAPSRSTQVDDSAIESFMSDDDSPGMRKSAFLLAGLAGLDRVDQGTVSSLSSQLEIDLARQTRWTRLLDSAADRNKQALVAMIAGLGMQGRDWSAMTPRYLYNIVSALRRSGLEAEARMIAAEAVARG